MKPGPYIQLLTSAKGANIVKVRNTPRSQELAPQVPWKGEEEQTHRHTVTRKTHVEKDWTECRLTYAKKEGEEIRNRGRPGWKGKMERSGVRGKGGRIGSYKEFSREKRTSKSYYNF